MPLKTTAGDHGAIAKGRGATVNPEGRFEKASREAFDDDWFQEPPEDEAAKPKTVVPRAAIVERAGRKSVFVVRDGKLELVPVTVGDEIESGFELVDGPPPGTRVVKNPAETLRDGQAVKEGSS